MCSETQEEDRSKAAGSLFVNRLITNTALRTTCVQGLSIDVEVPLFLCLTKRHFFKVHESVEAWLHVFSKLALEGSDCSAPFTPVLNTKEVPPKNCLLHREY